MSAAFESLGQRFRAAREARGMSLPDVAGQIRIRSVDLAAIEDESWSTIGAPVYVRGFLRTYARFLGLDPEEAVAAFNRTQPAPAQSSRAQTPQAADERAPRHAAPPRRGSAVIWIASVVAVLLIAFVVYNALTLRQGATPPTNVAGSAAPSPVTQLPATQVPAAPRAVRAAGGANSLALVFSAPSWLRVTVDGNVSMEGTFPAGTSKTFHGKNALVRLGNAGGVEIYVDGKDVGKLGKSGDVAEHTFAL